MLHQLTRDRLREVPQISTGQSEHSVVVGILYSDLRPSERRHLMNDGYFPVSDITIYIKEPRWKGKQGLAKILPPDYEGVEFESLYSFFAP